METPRALNYLLITYVLFHINSNLILRIYLDWILFVISQGRVSLRPNHSPYTFSILFELTGNRRQGFGCIQVIAKQTLAGVKITIQQSVSRLDNPRYMLRGTRCWILDTR